MIKNKRISLIFAGLISVVVLLILLTIHLLYRVPSLLIVFVLPGILFIAFFPVTRLIIGGEALSAPGQEEEIADKQESIRAQKMAGIDNYRKEFMGNVYHELKTPIFNLQGYILTLLDGGMEDESINRLYLERIAKNINRMISIVEDLEAISRLETEKVSLKKERFDIRKKVEAVFEANEMRAEKREVKLQFAMSKEIPVFVKGDRKKIYQVLNNLIVNSINYGSAGGKTIVSFIPDGKKVIIEIRDNGLGISKEDLPRIFERFYRVDKSRSRDSGGTGLGLAIVKHIIEAHKQKIKVESTEGKGTAFSFTMERG